MALDGSLIELGFIGAIALVTLYLHWRFDSFAVSHGPEILTTMGILGCFTGITLALFSFNTADVQASIPSLLGGIRTAFWASLAGVAGALSLRFAQRFRQPREADADEEVSPKRWICGTWWLSCALLAKRRNNTPWPTAWRLNSRPRGRTS